MRIACLRTCIIYLLCFVHLIVAAQSRVEVTRKPNEPKVNIFIDGKPFTTFFFTDTLEKPVLYPIYAADGEAITRGYPLAPKPGDPIDHPHHIGLWFNYENVNGLDFWNNSFAITQTKSGAKGTLSYNALWQDKHHAVLMKEATTFVFSAVGNTRIIDRTTTLTAITDVSFPDAKDGMLGLRVAHELQLPDTAAKRFTDDKGNVTIVRADPLSTGNYITSEAKEGNAAWGTRAIWCMLYGKIGTDTISIAIIDHPSNVGFPTYWHARGYGLFAANPLGQKIFSNGTEELNFKLAKGKSVTFRYRIVITSGNKRLSGEEVDNLSAEFEKTH
jgi:hypothetical protein